jgi:hypothetical protein
MHRRWINLINNLNKNKMEILINQLYLNLYLKNRQKIQKIKDLLLHKMLRISKRNKLRNNKANNMKKTTHNINSSKSNKNHNETHREASQKITFPPIWE